MKVEYATPDMLPEIAGFNKMVFPSRDIRFEDYFHYKFLEHPLYKNTLNHSGCFITRDPEGNIAGQFNLMPCTYTLYGEPFSGGWGMDYIVAEAYRNEPYGMLLAKKVLRKEGHFGVGLSPVSLKIHLAFGEKIIGGLKKYFHPNLLAMYPFTNHKSDHYTFPEQLRLKGMVFYRTDGIVADRWPETETWDTASLLFNRTQAFMNWRFRKNAGCQHIYFAANNPNTGYFVVRTGLWKGMKVLVLNDYRFQKDRPALFRQMLSACKKIMQAGRFKGILTTSSLTVTDNLLKKENFLSFGNERRIVSNIRLTATDEKLIAERNFVLLTLADSDSDYGFTAETDFTFTRKTPVSCR